MASQRISIGFAASPPVALRVSDAELSKLREALGGDGWHDVDGEDGTMRLNLTHVLWVRVDKEEARVGFGLA